MTFTIGKAKSAAREGVAEATETDVVLAKQSRAVSLIGQTSTPSRPDRVRLVADDFPFDESQLAAVQGMVASRYACLTGAAGTGKTTVTKKFVDSLLDSAAIGSVDMTNYWKQDSVPVDADDEYEAPESGEAIPAIALCAYTGRAVQQIKKNFPTQWHPNLMTIHRMLGFMPEMYEEWDAEFGDYRRKRRFIPTYNATLKMPWDIIIIDEAGMLGLDLWHQLLDACKPGVRIYMIGDINQLPPIYGKSIFGFAMARWPTFELTVVHRQQGKNNPIVDNAWRVIHGIKPQTEGIFKMREIQVDSLRGSSEVRGIARKLKDMGAYVPERDAIITPIHGINPGPGSALGDYPLNEQLSVMFNDETLHPRFVIDGGRERKLFAVGDKVMATKNDWASGITNGMTGIVQDIIENPGYTGNRIHYGPLKEVNERFANGPKLSADDLDFSMESLDEMVDKIEDKRNKKEPADRGPSSHTVIVRFGDGDAAFDKPFESLSEVGTLQLAYAITCHKMQGGEAPTIIIVCHESHSRSLNREWLYTAITRASKNCILLYTDRALRIALNRQAIAGSTLREKILSFQKIIGKAEDDDGNALIKLPLSDSPYPTILEQEIGSDQRSRNTERRLMASEGPSGLGQLLAKHRKAESETPPAQGPSIKVEVKHTVNVKVTLTEAPPVEVMVPEAHYTEVNESALPAPDARIVVPLYGAARTLYELRQSVFNASRALPAPAPALPAPAEPAPAKPKGFTLGQLFANKGK